MRSKLGFGRYGEYPLSELMALNKYDVILGAYYGVTNVDFDFEVKFKLNMVEKHLIDKPGKDVDMYKLVLEELYSGIYNRTYRTKVSDRAKAMTGKRRESVSADKLRSKNQGK